MDKFVKINISVGQKCHQNNDIFKFNQYTKLKKMPYIKYAELEWLVKRKEGCANNPQKSSTRKAGEHIICGYSLPAIWGFNHIKNKHTLYRGKDCMKKVL